MRTSCLLPAVVAAFVALAAPAFPSDPSAPLARASAAYYAALVASARGDIDATNRQLLLLAARSGRATRELRAAAPAALRQDPAWGAALQRAEGLLTRARERARARDIAGAHADLEEIRLVLHEVREHHNLWTLDDHLAELHEAVERVSGHISGRSEINFTPKDYGDVTEDLQAARTSWEQVEAQAGSIGSHPAWQRAANDLGESLRTASSAVAAADREALARSGERLKAAYFQLLTAIARARG